MKTFEQVCREAAWAMNRTGFNEDEENFTEEEKQALEVARDIVWDKLENKDGN